MAGREIAPDVTTAAREIRIEDARLILIASPHGPATGVYAAASGDLDAFGPRGIGVAPPGDAGFARPLGEAWGRPILDEPVDHGVVVPLRLLETRDVPVVAVTFQEGIDVAAAIAEAEALVAALSRLEGAVAFVASANTSAGLTERAPLPSLPGAAEADRALLDALRTDPRVVPERLPALAAAGSCGAGPLAALSFVLGSSPCDVVAYEHPAGVGYAVAVS